MIGSPPTGAALSISVQAFERTESNAEYEPMMSMAFSFAAPDAVGARTVDLHLYGNYCSGVDLVSAVSEHLPP